MVLGKGLMGLHQGWRVGPHCIMSDTLDNEVHTLSWLTFPLLLSVMGTQTNRRFLLPADAHTPWKALCPEHLPLPLCSEITGQPLIQHYCCFFPWTHSRLEGRWVWLKDVLCLKFVSVISHSVILDVIWPHWASVFLIYKEGTVRAAL